MSINELIGQDCWNSIWSTSNMVISLAIVILLAKHLTLESAHCITD
uniref:Uncharacterized protein n=1 Tax=Arundo donax TaxID=35708 RepID=A0A0A9AV92_ARUDO